MVEEQKYTKEHDKIKSRINGRMYEISLGEHSGMAPANPFASDAQRKYMNANPDVLGAKGLKEWNQSSKGMKLPNKVKK